MTNRGGALHDGTTRREHSFACGCRISFSILNSLDKISGLGLGGPRTGAISNSATSAVLGNTEPQRFCVLISLRATIDHRGGTPKGWAIWNDCTLFFSITISAKSTADGARPSGPIEIAIFAVAARSHASHAGGTVKTSFAAPPNLTRTAATAVAGRIDPVVTICRRSTRLVGCSYCRHERVEAASYGRQEPPDNNAGWSRPNAKEAIIARAYDMCRSCRKQANPRIPRVNNGNSAQCGRTHKNPYSDLLPCTTKRALGRLLK